MIRKGYNSMLFIALIGCMILIIGVLPAAATNAYKKLNLYEQDAYGQIIEGGANGQLEYALTGPNLIFEFKAAGLDPNTEYALIRSREPDVILPARYEIIAKKNSDVYGKLKIESSFNFQMSILSAKILLVPTSIYPDPPAQPKPLGQVPDPLPSTDITYSGKFLIGNGSIRSLEFEYIYSHEDLVKFGLICGGNLSPGPSDQNGLQVGDQVIDFTLFGIKGGATLTAGNQEQPLDPFTLSELYKDKPVLLVNGAFT
jgi:hypothetical protein